MNLTDKVALHAQICNQLNTVYAQKNHDYGDSFSKTYSTLGPISAATRITDKYNRMVALLTGVQAQVKDESIKDTLLDMANYCIMTVIEMEAEQSAQSTTEPVQTPPTFVD